MANDCDSEIRRNFRDRVRMLVRSILRSQGSERIALINLSREWWRDLNISARDEWSDVAEEELNDFLET